jgi:predicted enzyme related to lactoylglutathione lyase
MIGKPPMGTDRGSAHPLVHLELHTGDQAGAAAFLVRLLHWHSEMIDAVSCSYRTVDFGAGVGGGIVECGASKPLWIPYAKVERINEATEHARELGASVLLAPREGPSGWRSVISSPAAGEVALWELKR